LVPIGIAITTAGSGRRRNITARCGTRIEWITRTDMIGKGFARWIRQVKDKMVLVAGGGHICHEQCLDALGRAGEDGWDRRTKKMQREEQRSRSSM
jgi:hypothetical protein